MGELLAKEGFQPPAAPPPGAPPAGAPPGGSSGRPPKPPPPPIDWSQEVPRRQKMFLDRSLERRPIALKAAGAPPDLTDLVCSGATMDTFAVEKLAEWKESSRFALVLTGAPKTGKTCAAVLAMSRRTYRSWEQYGAEPTIECTRFDDNQVFVQAAELGVTVKPWDQDAAYAATTRRMKTCHLLVIDDLGREGTDIIKRLEEILIARHALAQKERPNGRDYRTIMTANMTTAAFEASYGARLFARMRSDAMVISC